MSNENINQNLFCSYCKKEMNSRNDLDIGHHLSCENPWEMAEINRYWDICCQKVPNIPVIKTTFEEFSSLNKKLNANKTDLSNFRNTLIGTSKLNRNELISEFIKNREDVLPKSLNKMPWLIFSVDWKVFLDPFNIEKMCKILDIEIVSEDIYGKEKFDAIKNKYQLQLQKHDLFGFLEDLSDYPLFPQQYILKYRIHYVSYESEGTNTILISEKPIDHITATFLYTYYHQYLSLLEIGYEEYYDHILVHEYRHAVNYYLDNDTFVKNQKRLIHNFKNG